MTKECAHCGGWGTIEIYGEDRFYECNCCNGTGETDDAEYEPCNCPTCDGEGCRRCKGTGETWRKIDTEPSEVAE